MAGYNRAEVDQLIRQLREVKDNEGNPFFRLITCDVSGWEHWALVLFQEHDSKRFLLPRNTDERIWMYDRIVPQDLTASDLIDIARDYGHFHTYFKIYIVGESEPAQGIYSPTLRRMGIAWMGTEATWATVDSLEQGIEMWCNNRQEWEERD